MSFPGDEYRGFLGGLAQQFKDDVGRPLLELIAKELKTRRPGGFVVVEFYGFPNSPVLVNPPFDTSPDGKGRLAVGSRGMPAASVLVDLADGDKAYYIVAHEFAHTNWVYHYENIGESPASGVAPEPDNPEMHDMADHNCLMSYSKYASTTWGYPWQVPGRFEPNFCGKCNLNLRGWNVTALPKSS